MSIGAMGKQFIPGQNTSESLEKIQNFNVWQYFKVLDILKIIRAILGTRNESNSLSISEEIWRFCIPLQNPMEWKILLLKFIPSQLMVPNTL